MKLASGLKSLRIWFQHPKQTVQVQLLRSMIVVSPEILSFRQLTQQYGISELL